MLEAPDVRDVLSLLYSCGMYNYSGEFAFTVTHGKNMIKKMVLEMEMHTHAQDGF